MKEYFSPLLVLHRGVSDILKGETVFTWAIEEVPASVGTQTTADFSLLEIEECVLKDTCAFPVEAAV